MPAVAPEELARRCREAGLRATPQRLAIFRALLGTKAHPSPEGVFAVVKDALPSLSLATVYNTLESLAEAGLIREVGQLSNTRRYDANQSHHHHLVCTACGAITDFVDPKLDDVVLPTGIQGFIPAEMQIQILGTCSACTEPT
jgi:Fur family peroxide stress response transcriptional regulator